MARSWFSRALGVLAMLAGCLALTRLVDAVAKRQLLNVTTELRAERAAVERLQDSLNGLRTRLDSDRLLLAQRLAVMAKSEYYLVVARGRGRLRLGLEDKTLAEVPFRVRGPADAAAAFMDMPRTTYEVLGTRRPTSWYRPDWLYRLEGVTPPADSAARTVWNALGPLAVYLGGGLAIHGPLSEDVPAEAIDYIYLELDTTALKSVCGVLKPGSFVFIQ